MKIEKKKKEKLLWKLNRTLENIIKMIIPW